ncbi:MAG: hypothetical protein ACI8RD_005964 [Bacillariaceae sp.]|jgi:hypothetical protein
MNNSHLYFIGLIVREKETENTTLKESNLAFDRYSLLSHYRYLLEISFGNLCTGHVDFACAFSHLTQSHFFNIYL